MQGLKKNIKIYAKRPESYQTLEPIELADEQLAEFRKQLSQGKRLKEILANPEYALKHISVIRTPDSFREMPFSLYGFFRWHQAEEIFRKNFKDRIYMENDVYLIDEPIIAFRNGEVIEQGLCLPINERAMDQVYLTLEGNLRTSRGRIWRRETRSIADGTLADRIA